MALSSHTSIKNSTKNHTRGGMPLHAVALYRLTILFLFTSTEMHLHSVSTGDIPPVKHTKKDILLDVLGMTNQTYPTLALSKSGYGSKLSFTLSH